MGGAGKGPGICWSRAQPKYSWEANLYATRWFCAVLSRTKHVKCFRVETICYRVVLRLKFIVTVQLLYDYQAESDFVQCQTKMRTFASRIWSEFKQIELNWNRIVHQNALWSLVFSTTPPWNKQISAPDASQPSSQERWQSPIWNIWRSLISFLFRG